MKFASRSSWRRNIPSLRRVTVGGTTVSKSAPFSSPNVITLGVPLSGWVSATAQAWNVPCGTTMPTPSWISPYQGAVLQPGLTTSVSITLVPNLPTSANVGFSRPAMALDAVGNSSSALLGDGSVVGWGLIIGNGSTPSAPTTYGTFPGATGFGATNNVGCVTVPNGVRCFGFNNNGVMGNGTNGGWVYPSWPATPSLASQTYVNVSVSDNNVCATSWQGIDYCWGQGTNVLPYVPTSPMLTPTYQGALGSFGVSPRGYLTCWDDNYGNFNCNGNLNVENMSGAHAYFTTPIAQWANGQDSVCGIAYDGVIWCYGENAYGQLGNGASQTTQTTPVSVVGLSNVTQIVGGYSHFCALEGDGSVWCWGANDHLQIGDASMINRYVPVRVSL